MTEPDYQTRQIFEPSKNSKPLMDMPDPPGFPSGWHWLILLGAAFGFIMILASGCTPSKSMIARKDCDEKMRLVLEAMRARTDTIVVYRTDTIVIREFRSDTVLKLDTLIHTIEKERLRVQWQVIRDTMHITAKCKTDTIYRTVAETTIKQGSPSGLVLPAEKEADGVPGWVYLAGLLILAGAGFLIYRKFFT
jgi:hypothetical protein